MVGSRFVGDRYYTIGNVTSILTVTFYYKSNLAAKGTRYST